MIWRGLFHLHRTKLLSPLKTSRTSAGQTLHSILAEVLPYIGLARALAVDCQLEDTCCRCCFVLTGRMCSVEVVMADTGAVEAPALRPRVPDDEGVLLLVVAPRELIFRVQSVVA
jgi:hypothetical protein